MKPGLGALPSAHCTRGNQVEDGPSLRPVFFKEPGRLGELWKLALIPVWHRSLLPGSEHCCGPGLHPCSLLHQHPAPIASNSGFHHLCVFIRSLFIFSCNLRIMFTSHCTAVLGYLNSPLTGPEPKSSFSPQQNEIPTVHLQHPRVEKWSGMHLGSDSPGWQSLGQGGGNGSDA